MLFSSMTFLFVFMPLVITVYGLSKREIRNYVLLIASIIFYAWGEPRYLAIMILTILVNYVGALEMARFFNKTKRKLILWATIAVDLGFLFYFKYFNFFVDNFNGWFETQLDFIDVVMPIGISFYTFQAMSYLIDVYRREVKAQKDVYKLALYIVLFPQLVAGPIVKYHDVCEQIDRREVKFNHIIIGFKRFIIGLAKKVLIANTLAVGDYPLHAEITAVNAQADAAAWNNAADAQYSVREYYFPRKVVVEEGTGTWCQWCPAGIVAFREMEKAYPDNFIGIAVHSQDVMAISTYQDLMSMFDGLPSCAVNRMEAITSPTFALVEHAYKSMSAPAQVGVEVAAEIATSGIIDVTAATTFGFDEEEANYRLCYVLIENGVTGTGTDYAQSNAYSGGASGEMGGFEDLPNPIPAEQMVYDHVARGIYQSFTGVLRSIPSTILKGVANPHTYKIRMPNTVDKTENLEIVAMVLDMETGEILNAEKAKVVDTTSGIRETSADASLRLYADGGRIVAEGECSAVEVYTLQGVAVANGGLQRGVYIVRATTPDGAVSRKVLVE